MGQSSSILQYGGTFKAQQWAQIRNSSKLGDSEKIEKGKCRTIKKLITGQQLEQYQLVFNQESELKQYIECFQWRLKQEYIVNTRFLINEKLTQFCSTKNAIKVYIQCIPSRLSDITDIPFPQNLYILKACFHGFQKLFKNIGYFKIEEDFICIDSKAHVKVWFNTDISKNYPNVEDVFDNLSPLLENKMVRQLMQIVEDSTDRQTEPELSFLQFLHMKGQNQEPTFSQAIRYLNQYSEYFDVLIPNYFESMLEIMNQENEAVASQSRIQGITEIAKLNQNSSDMKYEPYIISKKSSENYISLPKASHNHNDAVFANQVIVSNRLGQQHSYYPLNYQMSPIQLSNQNSFIHRNESLNTSLSQMKKSNQFVPYGCFLQKVSFSYSNQKQMQRSPNVQEQISSIVEEQKMQEFNQQSNQQKGQNSNPNYYRNQKSNFRIKSLIQQCDQEMEMSKSNHVLNRVESRQCDDPELKKRTSLSKSKSRSKHTFSKRILNAIQSIDQDNTIQKQLESKHESEFKASSSKSKPNKKNMIVISRQDQVYRSQNSPTNLNKNAEENINYSQINNKNSKKLEKINENPFAQFQGDGNFLTMVESNLNFANPSDPFATGRASRYATKEKSNLDWSKKYGGIQIDLDPQIVKDLKLYNI